MIPTKQSGPDDCLRACVASIMHLPMDRVPHFAEDPAMWVDSLKTFLGKFGLAPVVLEWTTSGGPQGFSIGIYPAGSVSTRRHCIVLGDGRPVWDPRGAGHVEKITSQRPDTWILFYALDLGAMLRRC